MSFKKRPSKEYLLEVIESCSKLKEVAATLNTTSNSVIGWMKLYGIYETHNFQRNVGQGRPWLGKKMSPEMVDKFCRSVHPRGKRAKQINRLCIICGTSMQLPDHSRKTTCSLECKSKHRSDLTTAARVGKSYCELYGPERAEEIIRKIIENRTSQLTIFSKPHQKLRDNMLKNGIYDGFETSKKIGRYEIDEFNESLRICIEVDGNYWHNYPEGRECDRKKDSYLNEQGYTVARFWESDINEDINSCIARLKEILCTKLQLVM